MKRFAIAIFVVLVSMILLTGFAPASPSPTSEFYVNDQAGVLSTQTQDMIVATGDALQKATGAQIVVVTLENLGGREINEVGLSILRDWGIGDKKKNNGVLLLVSIAERKVRIEVGYGLEGRLTDIKCGQILASYVLPSFKKDDFDMSVRRGYVAILQEVEKEYNVKISANNQVAQQAMPKPMSPVTRTILIILAIIFFLFDWIVLKGTITRSLFYIFLFFGRGGGGFGGGGGFSGGGGTGGGGGASRSF